MKLAVDAPLRGPQTLDVRPEIGRSEAGQEGAAARRLPPREGPGTGGTESARLGRRNPAGAMRKGPDQREGEVSDMESGTEPKKYRAEVNGSESSDGTPLTRPSATLSPLARGEGQRTRLFWSAPGMPFPPLASLHSSVLPTSGRNTWNEVPLSTALSTKSSPWWRLTT